MDNVRPRYRFQYEMSISDTPLTQALEKGDFAAAAIIIKNSTSDPESLDEGPYERFPLYIVVSGRYGSSEAVFPNLQIAQLLLEHGAQANKRGTVYNDMEAYGRSASPMELLVDIYRTLQLQHRYKQSISPLIGLDGLIKVQYDDVREHLLGLMRIFIIHGGQLTFHPGILGVSHLVNILWTSPDVDFLRYLYEAGVDVNQVDVHGRTALHLLCQVEYPPEYAETRLQAISYLLKHTNIQASKYSCLDHSCLWYALKRHHFDAVSLLLACEPTLDQTVAAKVFLSVEPAECYSEVFIAERLPPLLIPFVPARDIYFNADQSHYPNALSQQAAALRAIAKLVDQGYFCDQKIDVDISKLLDWHPVFRMHRKMLSNLSEKSLLVPFLFGQTSTKLKILCARCIFETCLSDVRCESAFWPSEYLEEAKDDRMEIENCEDVDGPRFSNRSKSVPWCSESYSSHPLRQHRTVRHNLHLDSHISKSVFNIDTEDLTLFLASLNLPVSFLSIFEFELYRRKLLISLSHSDSDRLKCSCLDEERVRLQEVHSEESSSDDESDNEGDGDAVSLISVNFLQ